MSEVKTRAAKSRDKKAALGPDLNLEDFSRQGGDWAYDPEYRQFTSEERQHLLKAGIELTDAEHAGTFLQADAKVVHCRVNQPVFEVMVIMKHPTFRQGPAGAGRLCCQGGPEAPRKEVCQNALFT
jgi:hypothetical protein